MDKSSENKKSKLKWCMWPIIVVAAVDIVIRIIGCILKWSLLNGNFLDILEALNNVVCFFYYVAGIVAIVGVLISWKSFKELLINRENEKENFTKNLMMNFYQSIYIKHRELLQKIQSSSIALYSIEKDEIRFTSQAEQNLARNFFNNIKVKNMLLEDIKCIAIELELFCQPLNLKSTQCDIERVRNTLAELFFPIVDTIRPFFFMNYNKNNQGRFIYIDVIDVYNNWLAKYNEQKGSPHNKTEQ